MPNKRIHAIYSGSVQGVGFRFTAQRTATTLGLAGWVRNLEDGGVEVLLEGTEARLKEFLHKMQSVFNDYIRDADIEWSEATGSLHGFDIKF